jgi:DNA (cytosine-5)-methyltransferase 1
VEDMANSKTVPKVIGLFSGCGGLDYGFQQQGFKIVYANDIEKNVKATYEYNLKHEIDINDLRNVEKAKIPQGDVILAGIPCQPFSSAGNRESTNTSDGNLFLQVTEVIKSQNKKPKVVIFENVRGFLSSRDCDGVLMTDRFIIEMGNLGYKTTYKLLNASDYGVPSNRHRVFIVCVDVNEGKEFIFPEPPIMTPKVTVGDVLSRKTPKGEEIEVWKLPPSSQKIVSFITEGGSWKDVPYEELADRHKRIRDNIKKYRSPNFYRRFARTEVMGTITATSSPENSGILHPLEDRRYSVREIARFQSYPDKFKFIGSGSPQMKYKMIGNSVPPKLAEVIAIAIKEQFF